MQRPYLVITVFCLAFWCCNWAAFGTEDQYAAKNQQAKTMQLLERNPYLADSDYPMIHGHSGQSGYTPNPGPTGPSRRLTKDEILVNYSGSLNGVILNYSGPYASGKQVIWAGGPAKVLKIDADSLATIDAMTFDVVGVPNLSETEVAAEINQLNTLEGDALFDLTDKLLYPSTVHAGTVYRIVDKDNDMYMAHTPDLDGPSFVRVFGDAVQGDPLSPIKVKRQWQMPEDEAPNTTAFALNMTYDGWVILVTHSGVVFAISRDLKTHYSLQLPGSAEAAASGDNITLTAYVRNGPTIDPDGGIYIIASGTLFRVQWTGKGLSLDPTDGGWSVDYPNESKIGSGSTPVLMGWGEGQDKLVVVTDGNYRMSLVAYWRDQIPLDWKGVTGQHRRVAGIVPVTFGNEDPTIQIRSEDAPVAWGYGVFITNSQSPTNNHTRSGRQSQYFAESIQILKPGYTPLGGMKAEWNPVTNTFDRSWVIADVSFSNSVCTVSGGSSMVYCEGVRNSEFTLEGIDWNRGKSAFHYILGSSQVYNLLGGCVYVTPDGDIDIGMHGGMSNIRIAPVH